MEGLTIAPQIVLLVVLLGCSAFFSGSETALMAVSRIRLRQMEKQHYRRVKIVEGKRVYKDESIGPVAQWKSSCLLSNWSGVRIPPGSQKSSVRRIF